MRLKNRVAIVTGAASGLGRGIARALAAEVARVAILDLNEAGARDTAEAIRGAGGQAHAIRTDVTRRADVEAAVAEVLRRHGTVDILGTPVPNGHEPARRHHRARAASRALPARRRDRERTRVDRIPIYKDRTCARGV